MRTKSKILSANSDLMAGWYRGLLNEGVHSEGLTSHKKAQIWLRPLCFKSPWRLEANLSNQDQGVEKQDVHHLKNNWMKPSSQIVSISKTVLFPKTILSSLFRAKGGWFWLHICWHWMKHLGWNQRRNNCPNSSPFKCPAKIKLYKQKQKWNNFAWIWNS